jgi:hypothetical protein
MTRFVKKEGRLFSLFHVPQMAGGNRRPIIADAYHSVSLIASIIKCQNKSLRNQAPSPDILLILASRLIRAFFAQQTDAY